VLDGNNTEVITTNGRASVSSKNYIEEFPWTPKPMYDISESMDGIQDNVSLMVIQNYATEETKKSNSEMLLNIAKENKSEKVKKFFTANESNKQTEFIRTDLNMENEETKPVMLLVNLVEMTYYRYTDNEDCEVTSEN